MQSPFAEHREIVPEFFPCAPDRCLARPARRVGMSIYIYYCESAKIHPPAITAACS